MFLTGAYAVHIYFLTVLLKPSEHTQLAYYILAMDDNRVAVARPVVKPLPK